MARTQPPRPFLDPVRNPQGGNSFMRDLERRVQRIERAPIKINIETVKPPEKAAAPAVGGATSPLLAISFMAQEGDNGFSTALDETAQIANWPKHLVQSGTNSGNDITLSCAINDQSAEPVEFLGSDRLKYIFSGGSGGTASQNNLALAATSEAGRTLLCAVACYKAAGNADILSVTSLNGLTWTLEHKFNYDSTRYQIAIFSATSTVASSGGISITTLTFDGVHQVWADHFWELQNAVSGDLVRSIAEAAGVATSLSVAFDTAPKANHIWTDVPATPPNGAVALVLGISR